MKLQTLLERKEHPRVKIFSDEALDKFRAIGHKFQVVLGSALAWPRIAKDRVTFAASIRDATFGAGGKKIDEPKHERLPLDIRVRGFLKALSAELTKYMNDGHEVRVIHGTRANSGGTVATPDTVYKLLSDNIQHGTFDHDVPEGDVVLWSVSSPKEENRIPYEISTMLTFSDDPEYETLKNRRFWKDLRISYSTIADDPEVDELMLQIKRVSASITDSANAKPTVNFFKSLMKDTAGKSFPYIPSYAPLCRMHVVPYKDVYVSKSAVKLSPEDFKNKVLKPIIANQHEWLNIIKDAK